MFNTLEFLTNAFMHARATGDGFNTFENALDFLKSVRNLDILEDKSDAELEDLAHQVVSLCDSWLPEDVREVAARKPEK